MNAIKTSALAMLALASMSLGALAQDAAPFKAADWVYGPNNDPKDEVEIWNTAKQKIAAGEDLVGGTVRSTDARIYCSIANAGYDFTWTEMQHEAISWETVAKMWATCPDAAAVPGVRLPYVDEHQVQQALDMGAMVLVFPTIDTVEEAQDAVRWTKFPPYGSHSSGGGQGPSSIWNDVPGGYRATFNDNIVVILMIETLEGVENVDEIAKVEGVDALFVASGDLGNFSGYAQGDAEYESLVDRIAAAAEANDLQVCGPLGWRADREGFTCFQGGNDVSLVSQGAKAELENTARKN